jgi:hypothetical protein
MGSIVGKNDGSPTVIGGILSKGRTLAQLRIRKIATKQQARFIVDAPGKVFRDKEGNSRGGITLREKSSRTK